MTDQGTEQMQAALRDMVKILFTHFTRLVSEGFEISHALQLTIALQQSMMNSSNKS